MNKRMILIKKACNILGVGMMLVGTLPTPVIAQVDAVEASAAMQSQSVLTLDMTGKDSAWIRTAILDGEGDPVDATPEAEPEAPAEDPAPPAE